MQFRNVDRQILRFKNREKFGREQWLETLTPHTTTKVAISGNSKNFYRLLTKPFYNFTAAKYVNRQIFRSLEIFGRALVNVHLLGKHLQRVKNWSMAMSKEYA